MRCPKSFCSAFVFTLLLLSCRTAGSNRTQAAELPPPVADGPKASERLAYIAKAQTWIPDSDQLIAQRDVLRGVPDSFFVKARQEVTCTFVEPSPEILPLGRAPQFDCLVTIDGKAKKLKIRYDPASQLIAGKRGGKNLEVHGEVLATRLLWSLGFISDRIYTVRVNCKNCPLEPWTYIRKKLNILDEQDQLNAYVRSDVLADGSWQKRADLSFDPALIEVKYPGPRLDPIDNPGWEWDDIYEHMDDRKQQKLYRDALTIVAAFLDHADNKATQQRLACFSPEQMQDGSCTAPYLMIQNAGASFGNGWTSYKNDGSLNPIDLEKWKNVSLWKDIKKCEVQLRGFVSGSLRVSRSVSEESRAFVAQLFARLSDQQIKDLFSAAQIELLDPGVSALAWAEAFRTKVQRDLIAARCG